MRKGTLFIVTAAALSSCQTTPKVSLNFDQSLHHIRQHELLEKGDLVLNSPPYIIPAEYPTAIYRGDWGEMSPKWQRQHHIYVSVQKRDCSQIDKEFAGLKGVGGEYLSLGSLCAISVYGRFQRHHFPWGDAISFISQGTQDGPYSPDNGHMSYQIWGVISDKRHLVQISVGITRPDWPDWPEDPIRSYKNRNQQEIDSDPDVRRLNDSHPASFTPSLLDVERLASTLAIGRGL